jgi:alkylation response protein AidB-like acyl-CoA dehydrogenase
MADILPTSPEQADLREAVRKVASRYGHKYFVDCATSHSEPVESHSEPVESHSEPVESHSEPVELYEELGAAGFLGVHLPEEYGGGARAWPTCGSWPGCCPSRRPAGRWC